ncbi:hypothetical protein GCM10009854_03550 [Saccharopolyspora halophila]|uniref:Uncharacterized protein n=1 Tax=Saccharopolyspora halophila TaxID=405551 RepID=A0ABN3FJQ6_9PSEU
MNNQDTLPEALDVTALTTLGEEHHKRAARALGTQEVSEHLVKVCALEAPGPTVADEDVQAALRVQPRICKPAAFADHSAWAC